MKVTQVARWLTIIGVLVVLWAILAKIVPPATVFNTPPRGMLTFAQTLFLLAISLWVQQIAQQKSSGGT